MILCCTQLWFKDTSDDEYNPSDRDVAVVIETSRGTKILKLNGHRYRKTYKTKNGIRWACSTYKHCKAYLLMSEDDEVIMTFEQHDHSGTKTKKRLTTILGDKEKAILAASRNGNVNLLYRKFAYRRKYVRAGRSRWACATDKSCRACLFVDDNMYVLSGYMEHCHPPPKSYGKYGPVSEDVANIAAETIKEEQKVDVKPEIDCDSLDLD